MLRKIIGNPQATWSNAGQKQAVMSALEWSSDLIVILPTGSGKSAIITVVAELEHNRITAILCPLRSLLMDWQRRLKKMHIRFTVFDPSAPKIDDQASIVLVSLDSTKSQSWSHAILSLRTEIPLARLVFDEAHLVLTEASYRDVMNRVRELRISRFQVVLLSATISPRSIPSLQSAFNLVDQHTVIRASSNRPELHFVKPVEYKTLDTKVS